MTYRQAVHPLLFQRAVSVRSCCCIALLWKNLAICRRHSRQLSNPFFDHIEGILTKYTVADVCSLFNDIMSKGFLRAEAVGLYVPGGTAVLPSSTLMLAVPAGLAGCKTIVMATPPRPDGSITPEVLYCAKKAGVTHILKAGGAQAIAAMAWGTKSCPKVHLPPYKQSKTPCLLCVCW